MIKNRLHITDDGSHTLYSDEAGETYHSTYGAIQESEHIFINAGLNTFLDKNLIKVKILEVGTGTGLNILLAYNWSIKNNVSVDYYGYEPFPIRANEVLLLNYPKQLNIDKSMLFYIHNNMEDSFNLSDGFCLCLKKTKIENANLPSSFYDVVFFDAFSPEAQPHMWTVEIFNSLYKSLKRESILTTYSCKGTVRRSLEEAGFIIEKLPGPPGKREFLRAWKH